MTKTNSIENEKIPKIKIFKKAFAMTVIWFVINIIIGITLVAPDLMQYVEGFFVVNESVVQLGLTFFLGLLLCTTGDFVIENLFKGISKKKKVLPLIIWIFIDLFVFIAIMGNFNWKKSWELQSLYIECCYILITHFLILS